MIPEAKQYFQDLALTKTQLGKVTRLAIDGGAQVYLQIIPLWDGEDDAFDITSVDDAALLPKLKVFDFGDSTKLRKKLGPALQRARDQGPPRVADQSPRPASGERVRERGRGGTVEANALDARADRGTFGRRHADPM